MFSVAGGGQMSLANENFRFGVYNDETVNLRRTGLRLSQLRMSTKRALLNMQHIHHLNISSLLGIFCADDVTFLVTLSCSKGALCDVLQNEKFNLDANFKHSMSADLASGLAFLHKQDLVHGALTSRTCLIDARWTVKITDWQIARLGALQRDNRVANADVTSPKDNDAQQVERKLFWSAPEVIIARRKNAPVVFTQQADVYR